VLLLALAACKGPGAALADAAADADEAPHHGTIELFSSGAEVPGIKPSVTLTLPDDQLICASDVMIDGCRIQKVCNPGNSSTVGAGELTLGTSPPITITSMPVARGQVEWHEGAEFAAGEAIAVTTDGSGTLPAMAATVSAPAQVTITSRFDAPIAAGSDFELTWNGGTTGSVALYSSYGTDGDFSYLRCTFPAASGHGTITAAAIQAYGFDGLASVYTFDVATVQVANWTVDFVVGFDGLWPDGSYAQGGFALIM
jgi:hypothetical protein